MTEETAYHPWSRRRWAAMLAVAVGVQFGLLSWLSAKAPLQQPTADPHPRLIVPAELAEEMDADAPEDALRMVPPPEREWIL